MQKRNCILVLKHLFMGERRVQGTLLTERRSKVKMSHQTREKARFRDQETRSLNLVFNVQRFMSISRDSQRERSRVSTRIPGQQNSVDIIKHTKTRNSAGYIVQKAESEV